MPYRWYCSLDMFNYCFGDPMRKLLLRWQYSFYKVQAYLAGNMDDRMTQINMESAASEAQRLYFKEVING